MALEQAGVSQPEPVPYDTDIRNDVAAAIAEVSKAPEPKEPEPKAAEVKAEPKAAETKTAEERARDEQGRFTKAEEKKEEAKAAEVKDPKAVGVKEPAKVAEVKVDEQPKIEPAKIAPPPGWSAKAKSQWDRLPQVVRDEIAKGTAPELSDLKPYIERAKQSGQSLAQSLQSYIGIEDLIRRDIRQGFLHIAGNAGLTQHQAGQLFQTLAQQLGVAPQGAVPNPGQTNGQGTSQTDQAPELSRLLEPAINPLSQRLSQLETMIRQQTEGERAQRLGTANSVIEKFRQSSEHRYYDNVEPIIEKLLASGAVPRTGDLTADLSAAYQKACLLDPEVSEILISERIAKAEEDRKAKELEAAEKARAASKSVTGSPSVGATDIATKRDPRKSYQEDLMDDVTRAVRSVGARA